VNVFASLMSRIFSWLWRMMARITTKILFPWAASSARHALASGLVSAANHTLGATTEHAKAVGAVISVSQPQTPSFLQPMVGAPTPMSSPSSSGLGSFLGGFSPSGHFS
jgi:hypothetical protein